MQQTTQSKKIGNCGENVTAIQGAEEAFANIADAAVSDFSVETT